MIFNNEDRETLFLGNSPDYASTSNDTGKIAKVPGSDKYIESVEGDTVHEKTHSKFKTSASSFNPLFRFAPHYGLTNADLAAKKGTADYEPTIRNLLNQQGPNCMPGLRYAPTDFMYCKDAEWCSGYHMITLRRFAYPIEDCLTMEDMPSIDVGRLVGYTTEETNKLSELMSMSFGLNWKELTADFWSPQIVGNESGSTGLLGTLFEVTNPMYFESKSLGANAINIDPTHDQNKVYGPVDSITKTHIRDRGLNFNHDIKLTFEYDLMAYGDANPRAAFLDLISNVLLVTFNDAKFWGGATKWIGMKRGAWPHYLSASDALRVGSDFNSAISYYKNQFNVLTGGKKGIDALLDIGGKLLAALGGFALDKILKTVGRPTVAVTNSLLSGEAVGNWHLTIGNPFMPILSIGNLILTDTQLSFGDTLGADGFPTTIKVNCSLKHAKPRSRAEIEMMFNQGFHRTYWQPNDRTFTEQLSKSYAYKGTDALSVAKELTNEIYAFLDNDKVTDFISRAKRGYVEAKEKLNL